LEKRYGRDGRDTGESNSGTAEEYRKRLAEMAAPQDLKYSLTLVSGYGLIE
jgi:hypothetical protein